MADKLARNAAFNGDVVREIYDCEAIDPEDWCPCWQCTEENTNCC